MKKYVVVDTNVLVSALITRNESSPTVKILRYISENKITPVYSEEIIKEYNEVLHRERFHFQEVTIKLFLDAMKQFGREVFPTPTGEILLDQDDLIFYEVAMESQQDSAYLVTGNMRHYPVRKFIVTPAQMMEILDGKPAE